MIENNINILELDNLNKKINNYKLDDIYIMKIN